MLEPDPPKYPTWVIWTIRILWIATAVFGLILLGLAFMYWQQMQSTQEVFQTLNNKINESDTLNDKWEQCRRNLPKPYSRELDSIPVKRHCRTPIVGAYLSLFLGFIEMFGAICIFLPGSLTFSVYGLAHCVYISFKIYALFLVLSGCTHGLTDTYCDPVDGEYPEETYKSQLWAAKPFVIFLHVNLLFCVIVGPLACFIIFILLIPCRSRQVPDESRQVLIKEHTKTVEVTEEVFLDPVTPTPSPPQRPSQPRPKVSQTVDRDVKRFTTYEVERIPKKSTTSKKSEEKPKLRPKQKPKPKDEGNFTHPGF